MALISQNTLRCSKILSHLKRLFGKKQLPLSLNEEGVAKLVGEDKKAESENIINLPKGLDEKIKPAVEILNRHGFKTFESCQGGEGHAFFEPTVRFEGSEFDLIRAYEICELYKLPVFEVRRVYRKTPVYINDNTPSVRQIGETWDNPFNEIIFIKVVQSSYPIVEMDENADNFFDKKPIFTIEKEIISAYQLKK